MQLSNCHGNQRPITWALFQTALSGVNCRQSQKMKDGYSYSHSLFFSSFLVFWYWSSKSGPSLPLLNYSQCLLFLSLMCRLIHECSCLMRWGIGIDLAHGSSLGVTPRVTCWQGWQNDGVSLKRSHWGEHISVCWRGSMTLSLYCLEGTITKIEKLSCQAVSGLEVVLTNKWRLVDQIFLWVFCFLIYHLKWKAVNTKSCEIRFRWWVLPLLWW